MPAQPQEKNIDDLLSQQHGNDEKRMQSELRREQMKAKKQKTISSVLGDLPQNAANSKQPADEQNTEQNAQQSETQNQQGNEERKVKKFWPQQVEKRQEIMKKLQKLQAESDKLEKLIGKYKSTNFLLLIFLASFVDMSDLPISFFWATVILSPIAICLTIFKESACLFIWIKIHQIKTDQKTNDGFWWTLLAFIIESIPGINALPATIARVYKARNSAKAQFEKHENEIKKIGEEMKKLGKQLK